MNPVNKNTILDLKQGKESAILDVFSNYKKYAKGYYTSRYAAKYGFHNWEDAVQECYITFSRNAHKFRGTSAEELESFTKTVFRNSISRYMESFIRSASIIVDLSNADDSFSIIDNIQDPTQTNFDAEVVNKVMVTSLFNEKVFPHLTESERELFRTVVSENDIAVIAAAFNISMDAARQRKCRLIKKIKSLLENSKDNLV